MGGVTRIEREQLVERILDLACREPDRSSRSIAREVGSSIATVSRHRRRLASDPAAKIAGLVEASPLPAETCKCSRSWSNGDGRCLHCGHDLPLLLAVGGGGGS
jgi:hypothetical protein